MRARDLRRSALFTSITVYLIVIELEFVDFIQKALDVSHSQQFGDEGFDFELLQIVDVLSGTDEDHRRLGRRHAEVG